MSNLIQIPYCTLCSLGEDNIYSCLMELSSYFKGNKPLMVIGDYPSNNLPDKPLKDAKFDLFWQVAKDACHIDPELVYSTYLVKCTAPKGTTPNDEHISTCSTSFIRKEIAAIKPKAILLLGAMAAKAFGFKEPIGKLRGKVTEKIWDKGDNAFSTSIIVAQSPTYIQYNQSELRPFAEDIYKAWQIAMGINPDKKESPTRVVMCDTIPKVAKLIEYIKQTGECTFDFETTTLKDMGAFDPDFKATLLAVSFQHGSAYTIPLEHFESPFNKDEVYTIFRMFSEEVWQNYDIHKINQNIKFDMQVAAKYGFPIFRGRLSCTMIMHSLHDDLSKHGIKEWLPNFFPKFEGWELSVKGKKYEDVPLDTLSVYGGTDADATFRGFTALEQLLLEDERVYAVFRNLYMFALRPLYDIERNGMLMSRDNLIKYEARAEELINQQIDKMNKYKQVRRFNAAMAEYKKQMKIAEYEQAIADTTKPHIKKLYQTKIDAINTGAVVVYKTVNFGSPKQLCNLLYTAEGFGFKPPYVKKKRDTAEVTSEVELKSLKDKSGFIQDLLILRSLTNTKSKYLTGLRELLDANDYIHTTYNQARVKTGRLSSGGERSGPNMQNIITHVKIKDALVEEITPLPKKAFIVPDGYVLGNADFSQAELRMIAELAEETTMIEAYNANKDLHIVTASSINKLTQEQWNALPEKEREDLRQKGKASNFGLIFLQSAEGFKDYAFNAYGVVLTSEEAYEIHSGFFNTYPKLSEYHQLYIEKCKRYGYVRTLQGKKAHYPDVNSPDKRLRGNAERELVNMPVQGSNGLNTVFALALLHYRLPRSTRLCNTVHDSIMFYSLKQQFTFINNVAIATCENTPMKRYFGKEMVHLKMKCDMQYSFSSWKGLVKYDREKYEEALDLI